MTWIILMNKLQCSMHLNVLYQLLKQNIQRAWQGSSADGCFKCLPVLRRAERFLTYKVRSHLSNKLGCQSFLCPLWLAVPILKIITPLQRYWDLREECLKCVAWLTGISSSHTFTCHMYWFWLCDTWLVWTKALLFYETFAQCWGA